MLRSNFLKKIHNDSIRLFLVEYSPSLFHHIEWISELVNELEMYNYAYIFGRELIIIYLISMKYEMSVENKGLVMNLDNLKLFMDHQVTNLNLM